MIKAKDDGSGGSTVYVVTAEDSAQPCPSCGVFATRLKELPPRHLSRGGRPVSIQWRTARWRCTEPALPTRLVHRGDPRGPRGDADHHRPAPGGGGRGLRRLSYRRAGPPRPVPEPTGRAAMLREPCCRIPARGPADHLGDRDRRDPEGQAGVEAEPRHRQVGTRRGRLHIGFADAIGGRGLFRQVEGRNAASVADRSPPSPPPGASRSATSPSTCAPPPAPPRPPGIPGHREFHA